MTDDEPAGYASSPCQRHELDPSYAEPAPPASAGDVAAWRKAERKRLIEARLAVDATTRARWSEAIANALESEIGEVRGLTVSGYWPFRGEPDLRRLYERLAARGGRIALPVVIAPASPLAFRAWTPGAPLVKGVWNIPIPAEGPDVVPDVTIAPVVGFDAGCWRLGYGGGYYDRTLAGLPHRPRVLGVGYRLAALPSIHPQPHDIPLDLVMTETGVAARRR